MKRSILKKKASPTTLTALRKRTAADVMSTPLVTARVNDSIESVARLFIEKRVSSVAVLNEIDQPVGVLTTSDLAGFAQTNSNLSVREFISPNAFPPLAQSAIEHTVGTVSPWMSRRVYSVAPTAKLKDVVEQMLRKRLHHLFVKNNDGRSLQGIVTTIDLVRELASLVK